MLRTKYLIMLFIMIIGVGVLYFVDFEREIIEFEMTERIENYSFAEPIGQKYGENLVLMVDPKIESANLVFEIIANRTGYSQYYDSDYMNHQIEAFKEFRSHEVFKIARSMYKYGFAFDAIPHALHYFDENLNPKQGLYDEDELLSRSGGIEQLQSFIYALYDFRAISDYDEYFRQNKSFYEREITKGFNKLRKLDLEQMLTDYYGYLLGKIRFVITPDNVNAFGCSINAGRTVELYPTLSFENSEEKLTNVIVHELSHPYINPLAIKYHNQVTELAYIYNDIEDNMVKNNYGSWETTLNEYIIRASVISMLREVYGDEYVEIQIEDEKRLGYIYIDAFYSEIEKYKTDRLNYDNFDQYYSVLLGDLKKINFTDDY